MRKVRIDPCVFLFSFCQPFVDFKQLGNYFAFGHFWVEAVGLHDGAVVFLVGFSDFWEHYGFVVEVESISDIKIFSSFPCFLHTGSPDSNLYHCSMQCFRILYGLS